MTLTYAALVPGLPQLLNPSPTTEHAALSDAMRDVGEAIRASGAKRIVYYSTQWLSVLGIMVQGRKLLEGVHVDPSWHQLGSIPFQLRVDQEFSRTLSTTATAAGFQTQAIDYEGFPIDTGTIVADKLINLDGLGTTMVSSWLYASYDDTMKFSAALGKAIANDPTPTAVIAVSSLSGNFFATDIDPREDRISVHEDDTWNKRILALMSEGHFAQIDTLAADYARKCRVDVGFKAMAFLRGVGAATEGHSALCRCYGPIHGSGAAVVEFPT